MQASATIIVGMIFLVTMRQALGLPVRSSHLRLLAYVAVIFVLASYVSFFMENPLYTEEARWWFGGLAMTIFNVGLILVATSIYMTVEEKKQREEEERKREEQQGKAFLKRAGVETDPDREYMKRCVSCRELIPLASETCEHCHTKQEQSKHKIDHVG